MDVSILVNDLHGRNIPRAYSLGIALKKHHDIEIIGPRLSGSNIYPPFKNVIDKAFKCEGVDGYHHPLSLMTVRNAVNKIHGDIIIAINPHLFTLGVAMIKSIRDDTPIILDVDDWKYGLYKEQFDNQGISFALKDIFNPNGGVSTYLVDKFPIKPDGVFAASTFLAEKYKADILVPHLKSGEMFSPKISVPDKLIRKLGIRESDTTIMFLGSPGPHKGVQETLNAINKSKYSDSIKYVIGGVGKNNIINSRNYSNLVKFGSFKYEDVPRYLAMADIVIINQQPSPATKGQMPAKLYDALAMGVPVIGTAVSDIPQVLEGCGIIVEPGNLDMLTNSIEYLVENPCKMQHLGKLSRDKFLREYAAENFEEKLSSYVMMLYDEHQGW